MSPHDPESANEPAPGRAEVRARLHDLYRQVDAQVAAESPICAVSGRCCRFDEWGHTLFVSSVEVDLLLSEAPAPSRPLDDGATCPWQNAQGRCTARAARPLGCRIYFCAPPSYAARATEIGEAAVGRLKQIVTELDLEWSYAPLHRHLRDAKAQGRLLPANDPGRSPPHPAPTPGWDNL